jgi:hypothetical protein
VLLEDLVTAIMLGGPHDPALGARLRKLGQLARDHVRVQERELFAFARIASIDADALGAQIEPMREHARVHVLRHLASVRAQQELAARRDRGEPAPARERTRTPPPRG